METYLSWWDMTPERKAQKARMDKEHIEALITSNENPECTCICHSPNRTVLHFVNCCEYCDKCKRNIKRGIFEFHNKHCNGTN